MRKNFTRGFGKRKFRSESKNISSIETSNFTLFFFWFQVICCSDSDSNISSLAASCLGQLGAVDPGLLPRRPKPKNSLPLSVHDTEFAYLALTKISRGFQNARNSVDMDAFAIAIQVGVVRPVELFFNTLLC